MPQKCIFINDFSRVNIERQIPRRLICSTFQCITLATCTPELPSSPRLINSYVSHMTTFKRNFRSGTARWEEIMSGHLRMIWVDVSHRTRNFDIRYGSPQQVKCSIVRKRLRGTRKCTIQHFRTFEISRSHATPLGKMLLCHRTWCLYLTLSREYHCDHYFVLQENHSDTNARTQVLERLNSNGQIETLS